MTISFERPVGAAADLAEIEYVSALHQTQKGLVRTDGSIRDVDVMHFLRSRYGIAVDIDTVRNTVLAGLGGLFADRGDGSEEDGEEFVQEDGAIDGFVERAKRAVDEKAEATAGLVEKVFRNRGASGDADGVDGIDLAEMVAVLLIPTLLKSARGEHSVGAYRNPSAPASSLREGAVSYDLHRSLQPGDGLIRDVFTMVMREATGSSKPRPLTASLMRDILMAYEEEELAGDGELLEGMVRAASSSSPSRGDEERMILDADAFARGLTSDVLLYDTKNEARLSTNFDDVLAAEGAGEENPKREEDGGGRLDDDDDDDNEDFVENETPPPAAAGGRGEVSGGELKLIRSAPSIDFVADQFVSKTLAVLLWAGFVLLYVAYNEYVDRQLRAVKKFSQGQVEDETMKHCGDVFSRFNSTPTKDVSYQMELCIQDFIDDSWQFASVTQYECPDVDGKIDWGCLVLQSVLRWFYILGLLMLLGLLYIGLGSIGNNVRAKRKWPIIFGILSVGGLSYGFFFVFYRTDDVLVEEKVEIPYYYDDKSDELVLRNITVSAEDERTNNYTKLMFFLSLILSSGSIAIQLFLLASPLVQRYCCKGNSNLAHIFVPGSVKTEANIKQAAARKINALVKNARDVHGDTNEAKASFGQGLINFSLQEKNVERAGGFLWTWKRIFNGELSTVEGIWISARIWAGNLAQVLISLFIIVFGVVRTENAVRKWREGQESDELLFTVLGWFGINLDIEEISKRATFHFDKLLGDFVSLNFGSTSCVDKMLHFQFNMSGYEEMIDFEMDSFDANNTNIRGILDESVQFCELLQSATQERVYNISQMVGQLTLSASSAVNNAVGSLSESIYPEEEAMVRVPLLVATSVSFLAGIVLSLIYIPSVVSTTLQLRSGIIPFFHDKRKQSNLRSGMDEVTILLGSMFWGLFYSAALLGIIFGGIVFLFMWQATRMQFARICASLLGLAVTMTVKMLIIFAFLRATVYVGYYRKKPVQGNVVSLILEVANIAYATLTALVRAGKLVLISTLFVGRLDTPVLADGVKIGPLGDPYPIIFRKDILAHEAHRHPYLETLGTMYMLKIRYAERFANNAGYCFRLIFCLALMPWIRKYRVMARLKLLDDDDEHVEKGPSILGSSLVTASLLVTASAGNTTMMGGRHKSQTDDDLSQENAKLRAEVKMLREALAEKGGVTNTETTHT